MSRIALVLTVLVLTAGLVSNASCGEGITIQSIKSGDMRPFVAQLDQGGVFGSVFSQVPADIMVGGKMVHTLVRLAAVLKKENGEWRIPGGMIAFSRVDKSLAGTEAKSR